MSDFGSTLRSIIKVCGVKSYILADALGYDPSYLSKWLNNSKRPPAAMIDGTAEEIAKVCVHSGDTSAFEKLAENYNIQSVDVSDKTACADVCDFEIAELNAFYSIPVGFAAAGELVHYLCIAEDGLDTGFIADAG